MTTLELIERGVGHNCLSDAYELGRNAAIEEFVNEYKNFVSDEGECNLQEDCSYSGGWCIDCFKEKWMKDSKK